MPGHDSYFLVKLNQGQVDSILSDYQFERACWRLTEDNVSSVVGDSPFYMLLLAGEGDDEVVLTAEKRNERSLMEHFLECVHLCSEGFFKSVVKECYNVRYCLLNSEAKAEFTEEVRQALNPHFNRVTFGLKQCVTDPFSRN
ncbi:hypothetical protein [Maridesulfovibrio sp.]|uniref:hypothetical protein n=1 Tax=Maridesulfovibrio sp. TaxID=2795000 RepID=UPI0029F50EE2|nr:hypothetical protein [Maridesulfovibrio sp.]